MRYLILLLCLNYELPLSLNLCSHVGANHKYESIEQMSYYMRQMAYEIVKQFQLPTGPNIISWARMAQLDKCNRKVDL